MVDGGGARWYGGWFEQVVELGRWWLRIMVMAGCSGGRQVVEANDASQLVLYSSSGLVTAHYVITTNTS